MRQSNFPHGCIHGQRLYITGIIRSGRRIADVADADMAAFIVGYAVFKDSTDKAHTAVGVNIRTVCQRNTAAFLTAML